jgi:hypothetical protein
MGPQRCSWIGLLLGSGIAFSVVAANGQPAPNEVITDTPQYCLQLLDRVSALERVTSHPPAEVSNLSSEGERMCDLGQTRGGIMRLRRALVLLRAQMGQP